eukprot:1162152-Pelagomonas_calceolata.AAC.6
MCGSTDICKNVFNQRQKGGSEHALIVRISIAVGNINGPLEQCTCMCKNSNGFYMLHIASHYSCWVKMLPQPLRNSTGEWIQILNVHVPKFLSGVSSYAPSSHQKLPRILAVSQEGRNRLLVLHA